MNVVDSLAAENLYCSPGNKIYVHVILILIGVYKFVSGERCKQSEERNMAEENQRRLNGGGNTCTGLKIQRISASREVDPGQASPGLTRCLLGLGHRAMQCTGSGFRPDSTTYQLHDLEQEKKAL